MTGSLMAVKVRSSVWFPAATAVPAQCFTSLVYLRGFEHQVCGVNTTKINTLDGRRYEPRFACPLELGHRPGGLDLREEASLQPDEAL